MTAFYSNSWCTPAVESSILVYESPKPWGPWTLLLEENVQHKEGDNLTWTFLTQKFTSPDGKKMWTTTCGRHPYALTFLPVYLTTSPVQTYQAEDAKLTGGAVDATNVPGFTGKSYATGLTTPAGACRFTVHASKSGVYLLKLRYHTTAYLTVTCRVNNGPPQPLQLGKSEQDYATWTEYSLCATLVKGKNTVSIQCDAGDSGQVDIDSLAVAFYSE